MRLLKPITQAGSSRRDRLLLEVTFNAVRCEATIVFQAPELVASDKSPMRRTVVVTDVDDANKEYVGSYLYPEVLQNGKYPTLCLRGRYTDQDDNTMHTSVGRWEELMEVIRSRGQINPLIDHSFMECTSTAFRLYGTVNGSIAT